ncbi:hypothetical protein VTN00DRAFT_6775 [Thermoascus crustaceus]|uniref:uncharacterized protein n=1 Tax=Thermoascus crustaceus TaxID=5088 RepID=UPI00374343F2
MINVTKIPDKGYLQTARSIYTSNMTWKTNSGNWLESENPRPVSFHVRNTSILMHISCLEIQLWSDRRGWQKGDLMPTSLRRSGDSLQILSDSFPSPVYDDVGFLSSHEGSNEFFLVF